MPRCFVSSDTWFVPVLDPGTVHCNDHRDHGTYSLFCYGHSLGCLDLGTCVASNNSLVECNVCSLLRLSSFQTFSDEANAAAVDFVAFHTEPVFAAANSLLSDDVLVLDVSTVGELLVPLGVDDFHSPRVLDDSVRLARYDVFPLRVLAVFYTTLLAVVCAAPVLDSACCSHERTGSCWDRSTKNGLRNFGFGCGGSVDGWCRRSQRTIQSHYFHKKNLVVDVAAVVALLITVAAVAVLIAAVVCLHFVALLVLRQPLFVFFHPTKSRMLLSVERTHHLLAGTLLAVAYRDGVLSID